MLVRHERFLGRWVLLVRAAWDQTPEPGAAPPFRSRATSANERPSRMSLPIAASRFQASWRERFPTFTVSCSKRALAEKS